MGLIQTTPAVTATSGTTLTLTFGSNTGTGNSLVVYIGSANAVVNATVSGITLGGSADHFASAVSLNNNAQVDCEIWIDPGAASGQTSVVVSFSGGSGAVQGIVAYAEEWSGIVTASTVDKISSNSTTGNSWTSNATATLSFTTDLAVGACFVLGATSITGPGGGWTNHAAISISGEFIGGHNQLSANTGVAYAGTATVNSGWTAVVATLKTSNAINVTPPVMRINSAAFAPLMPVLLPLMRINSAALIPTPEIAVQVSPPVMLINSVAFPAAADVVPLPRPLIYSITELADNSLDPYGNYVLQGATIYTRGYPSRALRETTSGFRRYVAATPVSPFTDAITPPAFSQMSGGDTTQLTASSTSASNISANWSVTSGDSQSNTVYELDVLGSGIQSTGTKFSLTFQINAAGNTFAVGIGNAFAGLGEAFYFRVKATAIPIAPNATTSIIFVEIFVYPVLTGPTIKATFSLFSWNTAVGNSFQWQASWGGNDGTNSVTGYASIFRRGSV